jgi:hypothetical protein
VSTPGHPDWCGQGHRCGLGEHRSEPIPLPGGLVLVLVQRYGSARRWVEFTGSAMLTNTDQAGQLTAALDLAVRAVLAGDVEQLADMMAVAGAVGYPQGR